MALKDYTPPSPLPTYDYLEIINALRTSYIEKVDDGVYQTDPHTQSYDPGEIIYYTLQSTPTSPMSAQEKQRMVDAMTLWDDLIASSTVRDDQRSATQTITISYVSAGDPSIASDPFNNA